MSTVATKRAFKVLIDGEWLDKKETYPVHNPANRETITDVPKCGKEEVEHAVRAARIAFESGKWPKMSPLERGHLLFKVAEMLRDQAEDLAELETLNSGRPIRETRNFDVEFAARCFEYYAGLASKIHGETFPTMGNTMHYTMREPIGVIAQFVPFTFTLLMAAWKLAPALAAGNTVILTPSYDTPLTALRLGELMMKAGFPSGVINIITGPEKEIEQHLTSHPGVDKVVFTGRTEQGRFVMETAAKTTKDLTLELGGRSPNIVFADADLDRAIDETLFAVFFNQGQVCSAGSRLFVQESIYNEFVKKFVEKVEKINVNDPTKKDTQMGPVVSKEHMEHLLKLIDKGQKEGAKLLTGGKELTNLKGYFIEPTVFGDVKNEMTLAREEIFGPIVSIIKFKDESDVIRQANDTVFGSSSALWTRDLNRVHRLVEELKVSTVWVNGYGQMPDESPFGGFPQSGGRELGYQALNLYTRHKSVYIDLNEKQVNRYTNK